MNSGNNCFSEINEKNILFWRTQSELTLAQLSDETLFKLAQAEMNSELHREVPLRSRKTLEHVLAIAADTKRMFHADLSRKGGMSRKGDALHGLVCEIAERRPTITSGQLLHDLAGSAGAGTIIFIENESDVLAGEGRRIRFVDYDGRTKTAPISGLKYRLARAKREIKMQ